MASIYECHVIRDTFYFDQANYIFQEYVWQGMAVAFISCDDSARTGNK